MKKKYGEETLFSLLFFSSQTLRIKPQKSRFYTHPRREDSPLSFMPWNHIQSLLNGKSSFSFLLHAQKRIKSAFIWACKEVSMKSPTMFGLFHMLSPPLTIPPPKKYGMPPFKFFHGKSDLCLISYAIKLLFLSHKRKK